MKTFYIIKHRCDFESDFIDNERLPLKGYGKYNISIFDLYEDLPKDTKKYLAEKGNLFKVEMDEKHYSPAIAEIIKRGQTRTVDEQVRDTYKCEEAKVPHIVKVNLVSQIMPNGKERTEIDALKEQYPKLKKEKKDSIVLRCAVYAAQKVIDIQERNIGKDLSETKTYKRS